VLALAALVPSKRSSNLAQVQVPAAFEQWRPSMAQLILAPVASAQHFSTVLQVLALAVSSLRFSKPKLMLGPVPSRQVLVPVASR
jgi:hypothetical protein